MRIWSLLSFRIQSLRLIRSLPSFQIQIPSLFLPLFRFLLARSFPSIRMQIIASMVSDPVRIQLGQRMDPYPIQIRIGNPNLDPDIQGKEKRRNVIFRGSVITFFPNFLSWKLLAWVPGLDPESAKPGSGFWKCQDQDTGYGFKCIRIRNTAFFIYLVSDSEIWCLTIACLSTYWEC
jgi:hypothetical protein